MVALVTFIRSSFNQEYSYLTDIDNLKPGDIVVVEANESYSTATFQRYTNTQSRVQQATKWIVQKVDIEDFEMRRFLDI